MKNLAFIFLISFHFAFADSSEPPFPEIHITVSDAQFKKLLGSRGSKLDLKDAAMIINGDTVRNANRNEKMDTVHIKGIVVYGKSIDNQTRCVHYHSSLDIIAIKFKCCNCYFPCYSCHAETTDHEARVWPVQEFNAKAILCGVCGNELSISDYMACDNTCPTCSSLFNPSCKNHYHLYFETEEKK